MWDMGVTRHQQCLMREQVDASLDALEQALKAGFEGYNKIREDPNLENLRKSKKFAPLIDKYDEPVFNSGAFE